MDPKRIVETVKESVSEAKGKVERVAAHAQEVVAAGAQTLAAAKEVVDGARRETADVLTRKKDELKQTLKQGAEQVGEKLSRITQMTRKEQAAARKAEVKAKKRAAREQDAEEPAAT